MRRFLKIALWLGLGLFALLLLAGALRFAYLKYERKIYLANLKDTASPNVQVLKDTIMIDYLGENRTLRVYLPPGYSTDTLDYPVIYLFDASALFNERVQEGNEWQVDEVIDSIAAAAGPAAIVVGIENSEARMTEYKPFLSPEIPDETSVTGDQHAEWIATDLKDWIDKHYRTKTAPANTTIGGASLGGLMAYYMITEYPEVFGNALVFSPSLWVNEKVFRLHEKVPDFKSLNIYLNIGELEGGSMIPNTKKLRKILEEEGMTTDNLRFDIEPNIGHEALNWRRAFRKAYPWLMSR